MEKRIICFSPKGRELIKKINDACIKAGIEPAVVYDVPADEFAKEGFAAGAALIFVGATGIAVRTVARYVNDKLSDSPVIVTDDNGTFVIPILSGHAGGANKLAVTLAKLIDAVPVITTSTDVNGVFSADVFAAENRLKIRNRDGIKKVSVNAIEGKPVTVSIKDYPPAESVDIIIADETDREYSLLLSPKRYTLGIGLKKGTDPGKLEDFVLNKLHEYDIGIDDVYATASIDIKEDEPALKSFCGKYRLPLIVFEASVLKHVQGTFSSSDFVFETVGVDNVCERAAVLAAGSGAKLVAGKAKGEGMTLAIAERTRV